MKIVKCINKTYNDIINDFFYKLIYPNHILDKHIPKWRKLLNKNWSTIFKEYNLSQQQINQFYLELKQYKNEQENISNPSYR